MLCTSSLRLATAAPLGLRTSTKARRTVRNGAVRTVAFRTDEDDTKDSATEFKQIAQQKAAEVGSVLEVKAGEAATWAQNYWEASPNKPGLVAGGVLGLVSLYLVSGLVEQLHRLPLLSTLFELVGFTVSAWFAYRWFFVAGEREAISRQVSDVTDKLGL